MNNQFTISHIYCYYSGFDLLSVMDSRPFLFNYFR